MVETLVAVFFALVLRDAAVTVVSYFVQKRAYKKALARQNEQAASFQDQLTQWAEQLEAAQAAEGE